MAPGASSVLMRTQLDHAAVKMHVPFRNWEQCDGNAGQPISIQLPQEKSPKRAARRRNKAISKQCQQEYDPTSPTSAALQQAVAAMWPVRQEQMWYEPGYAMTSAIQLEQEKLWKPTDALTVADRNNFVDDCLSYMPAPDESKTSGGIKRFPSKSFSKFSTMDTLPSITSLSKTLQEHGVPTQNVGAAGKNDDSTPGKEPNLPNSQADAPGLTAIMSSLREFDRNQVLMVRKINQLGFESEEVLKAHYAQYGEVKRVYLSRCLVRARAEWVQRKTALSKGAAYEVKEWRQRPSTLGFIVMGSAAEVQAILAEGKLQQVYFPKTQQNVTIHAEPFQWKEEANAAKNDSN